MVVDSSGGAWPGLSRRPGTYAACISKVVGGRAKPGHDTTGNVRAYADTHGHDVVGVG